MPVRYLPMLKTKAGEITALENLNAATKGRVLPVFHVTTSVSPRFAPGLGNAWNNRALAVDGSFSFNTGGSTAPFNALVRALRQHGVLAYPSYLPRLILASWLLRRRWLVLTGYLFVHRCTIFRRRQAGSPRKDGRQQMSIC